MDRDRFYYSFVTNDVKWATISTVLFFATVWFIWVYYLMRIEYYTDTTTITLKRIKGLKMVYGKGRDGTQYSGYVDDIEFKEFPATGDDFKKNNRKAIFFTVLLFINLFMLFVAFE